MSAVIKGRIIKGNAPEPVVEMLEGLESPTSAGLVPALRSVLAGELWKECGFISFAHMLYSDQGGMNFTKEYLLRCLERMPSLRTEVETYLTDELIAEALGGVRKEEVCRPGSQQGGNNPEGLGGKTGKTKDIDNHNNVMVNNNLDTVKQVFGVNYLGRFGDNYHGRLSA